MTQLIKPLKDNWMKPDLTKDDIKERVDSESNYAWARNTDLSVHDRAVSFEEIGRNYKLSK